MNTNQKVLDTAKMLLDAGYRVHPVYGIFPDGRCGCGSRHESEQGQGIGKHPIYEDWLRKPALYGYFCQAEDRPVNIAIECGPQPNGIELFGIDYDNMDAETSSACFSVTRRGWHEYFDLRHTGLGFQVKNYLDVSGSRSAGFPNGIDFKYKGGALLIEPSLHRDGPYATTLDAFKSRRIPGPDARQCGYITILLRKYHLSHRNGRTS